MELIPAKFRINMKGSEDLIIGQLVTVKFIGIIGHVDFFFANQLPVIPIRGPAEHIKLVRGSHAV